MNRLELRAWRRQRRMTQPGLAGLLGVSKNTEYRWESGESSMPPFLQLALERLDQVYDWAPRRTTEAGELLPELKASNDTAADALAALQRRIADELQRQINARRALA
jgi:transcriptional regulator with XRE-family HTH domain